MIHPISGKTSTQAWLRAVNLLIEMKGRCAYNVILATEDPITLSPADKGIVAALDSFLVSHNTMPVTTVAGTIFPAAHYRMRGAGGVLEDYPNKIYPKLKKHWGTYAGRMLIRMDRNGQKTNPLKTIISKLKQQSHHRSTLRAIYEVSLVDIFADIPLYDQSLDARRTLNQPCLVHLSFKLHEDHGLMLTALYRSHYYVSRALGNLIGLSQLLFFVAKESGLTPRGLVCHSTFARIDMDGGWTVGNLKQLVTECNRLEGSSEANRGHSVVRV